jgi:glycosyltransferase involved in cell wall biosynthesis
MKGRVQLYILTYNRPNMVLKCIESVLNQTDLINVQIIVSDNSDNDDTEVILHKYASKITYLKRVPSLRSDMHFSALLKEANGEFVTLFHDDDILFPSYIEKVRERLVLQSDLIAVCSNAFYIKEDILTNECIRKSGYNEEIINQNILTREYIKITDNNPPPFSGYMYRVNAIKNLSLNIDDGGKYCDLAFLIKVASAGKIMWLSEALMGYRIHSNNDTKTEEINDRLKLVRFIRKHTDIIRGSAEDKEMRFIYWYRWLKSGKSVGKGKRIGLYYIAKYFVFNLLPSKRLWLKVFNKKIRKRIA